MSSEQGKVGLEGGKRAIVWLENDAEKAVDKNTKEIRLLSERKSTQGLQDKRMEKIAEIKKGKSDKLEEDSKWREIVIWERKMKEMRVHDEGSIAKRRWK